MPRLHRDHRQAREVTPLLSQIDFGFETCQHSPKGGKRLVPVGDVAANSGKADLGIPDLSISREPRSYGRRYVKEAKRDKLEA